MNWEELVSPAGLVVLVLLGLAFIRFGIWWAVFRTVLAPLMRPVGLIVVVIAVFAVVKLTGHG